MMASLIFIFFNLLPFFLWVEEGEGTGKADNYVFKNHYHYNF